MTDAKIHHRLKCFLVCEQCGHKRLMNIPYLEVKMRYSFTGTCRCKVNSRWTVASEDVGGGE